MAEAVYLLCALTSIVCAILLYRGFRASRTRLLFWSALCFTGLAVNNVLLVLDALIFVTEVDLALWRGGTALGSLMILVYGLVWESP